MIKKYVSMLVVVMMALAFVPSNVRAFGDIVYDPTNWAENFATQVNSFATQLNTFKMWEQQVLHTTGIVDLEEALTAIMAADRVLKDSFTDVQEITRLNYLDVALSADQLETNWQTRYKGFDYSAQVGAERSAEFARLLKLAAEDAHRSKRAQGIMKNIIKEQEVLDELMKNSRETKGSLSSAQIANEITGMQTKQMMRLQEVIVANQQSQEGSLELKLRKEEMARESVENFYKKPTTAYVREVVQSKIDLGSALPVLASQ